MYTIEKYIQDTLRLTNSIIVKINDIGVNINKGLYLKYGIKPDNDKRKWKYYQNIAGIKHYTNSDVLVYVTETGTNEKLSKELLNNYPVTKNKLLEFGEQYKNLLLEYPEDIEYILGCMLPVDIDTAINSEDGSILNYNKNDVQSNEFSLIRELEKMIQNFIRRWYVSDYNITDELYMASFIGVLYAQIPNMIMSIRFDKVKTNEAHMFHVENYFRSKLDIWDDVKILKNETLFWLYKNIDNLIHNIGSNKTLDKVFYKIFEENGIGVGSYDLVNSEPSIDKDNFTNPTKNFILNNPNLFKPKPMNNKFEIDASKYHSADSIIYSELVRSTDIETATLKDRTDFLTNTVSKYLRDIKTNKTPTKILEIESFKLFKLFGNDPFIAIMDHWLKFATNGVYTRKQLFVDPNTKKSYKLSPIEGLYLVYYIMLSKTNSDSIHIPIKSIYYSEYIDINIDKKLLLKNIFNTDKTKLIYEKLNALLPDPVNKIVDNVDFSKYMLKLRDVYTGIWILDSNINNATISSNIKLYVNNITTGGSIDVGNKSINDLVKSFNGDIDVSGSYNGFETIAELIKTFTGVSFDDKIKLEEALNHYINILLKLSSYTTQILKSNNNNDILYAPYSTIEAYYSDNGIINTLDAEISYPLEPVSITITAKGNDYKLTTDYIESPYIPTSNSNNSVDFNGTGDVYNDELIIIDKSTITIETATNNYMYNQPKVSGTGNTYTQGTINILNIDNNNNKFKVNSKHNTEMNIIELINQPFVALETQASVTVEIE